MRSCRPAEEQQPAADAGRGRVRDPTLDVAAVACHAERVFTQAAAVRIDAPPNPVASIRPPSSKTSMREPPCSTR